MLNQTISDKDKKVLENMVTSKGYTVEEIFPGGLDITNAQFVEAVKKLEKLKAKK